MATSKKKGRKTELTRREIAAKRRAQSEGSVDSSSFQRSRTISAHRPQDVADQVSERQASWALRQRRNRMLRWLVGLAVLAFFILFILMQLVVSVDVQSTGKVSDKKKQTYTKTLDDYLAVRPIERLRLLIDSEALHAFFLERSPEVKSVEVVGGGKLTHGQLRLVFRQPIAQWTSGGKVYFVDDNGVTFEQNYFSKPNITVKDRSGVPASAGQEVIDRRFLGFLGKTVALLQDKGLTVTEVSLPPNMVRQLEIAIGGKSYVLKMTVDRSPEAQVDEAVKAMKFIDGRGMRPKYIDVRVDQRVFYR